MARLRTHQRLALDVQPDGMLISFVFFLLTLTSPVCCARWTSARNIFPEEFCSIGSVNVFAHSVCIQFFHHSLVAPSSLLVHYADTSVVLFFSFTGIRLPVPRKINVGRTRATPLAKSVSWTVTCSLSKPD